MLLFFVVVVVVVVVRDRRVIHLETLTPHHASNVYALVVAFCKLSTFYQLSTLKSATARNLNEAKWHEVFLILL